MMRNGIKKRGNRLTFHVGDDAARPDDVSPVLAKNPIAGEAILELLAEKVPDAAGALLQNGHHRQRHIRQPALPKSSGALPSIG